MSKLLYKLVLSTCTVLYVFSTIGTAQAAEITKYGSAQAVKNDYLTNNEEQQIDKKIPENYNSNELGYVTPVKDQNNSNICWAYASNSSFESLLLRDSLFRNELSVEHMDNWATPNINDYGWQRKPGEGGYTYIPCGYYTSWNGAVENNSTIVKQGITSLIYLGKGDEILIKKSIMESGAVTANLAINSKAYSSDNNSYCLNREIRNIEGHTISVVGWDDNYSKDNFDGRYTPKNNGAWLCKNSWGTNVNSIGGYLWVSYEDKYIFDNDVFSPSFSIKDFVNLENSNYSLYQNEQYGATYEFEYCSKESNDITYLNVFDFSEKGNVIKKIVFETLSLGASYTTYFVPVVDDKPTGNTKYWKKLSCGTVDYTGYICDNVNVVVPQEKGAVAVKIFTDSMEDKNSVGVDEWLTDTDDYLLFKDKVEKGKSFVYYSDKMEDIKYVYKDKLNDDIGGNLVIKAITNETYNIQYGDVNCDGKVNIKDATEIQKALAKIKQLDLYQNANADANKDNRVNIRDASYIQRKIAKIIA